MGKILTEARRLHDLGFALLRLHPKSKRPIASKWTTGPRTSWEDFVAAYNPGENIGVRLGEPSKIFDAGHGSSGGSAYLACIDVDIKDPTCKAAALEKLDWLSEGKRFPVVQSGSGNGSRHVYCITRIPFKMITVHKEPGWEICIYSTGRQMVLPPSVHPDSGKPYKWAVPFSTASELPIMDFSNLMVDKPKKEKNGTRDNTGDSGAGFEFDFTLEDIELSWLPISDKIRDAISDGRGVTDRSGFLLPASAALLSAGLTENQVLNVLTDPTTFIGQTAYSATHANTRDRAAAARWVYRYTLAKVARERSPLGVFDNLAVTEDVPLTEDEIAEMNEELLDTNWRNQLVISKQTKLPLSLTGNVVLVLNNSVDETVVRRNEFALRDTFRIDTPWGQKAEDAVSDDGVAAIKFWCGKTHGFEPNKDVIYDALTVIAVEKAYDPVKDMLEALPPWDGKKRLDSWLSNNFEAKGDPEYLAQVFRKWIYGLVQRVYKPGSKFDWMPIFEGAQGIGKSSFGRVLVGDKYFLDWLPNLGDKDSAIALQGIWLVELGELSQFRKNELESIKAFITRTIDKFRPPHGRKMIESPRRCIFFGTTNREKYLTDDTGNRRFKPVKVGQLNFKALRRDRDQLFAEAKYLYDQKIETEFSTELTGNAKIFESQIHAEKMVEDDSNAMEEIFLEFAKKAVKKEIDFDLKKFSILNLFSGDNSPAGPFIRWPPIRKNQQLAGKMLKRLGGSNRKINGLMRWKIDLGDRFDEEVVPDEF
jgi:hypothetical protein